MENRLTVDEIIRLIEKGKEVGLTSLEASDIVIKYDALPKVSLIQTSNTIVPDVKLDDLIKPEAALDQMTEEEIKYYATPYYDELQALKEEQKKAKEESP